MTWLNTRAASSVLPVTRLSAPTRSLYSDNDFENELETTSERAFVGEAADFRRLGIEAFGKSLVGDVEERNELGFLYGFAYLLPLLRRRIDAGRIVAARVQHDDSAARHPRSVAHGIQADAALAAS